MSKDITQYNDKGEEHGYWEGYHPKGHPIFKCFYVNGKEIGYEEMINYNQEVEIIFHL